jgi:hypothetical protein
MRHLLRAFLRLMNGASWKKGHLEQSVLKFGHPQAYASLQYIATRYKVCLTQKVLNRAEHQKSS